MANQNGQMWECATRWPLSGICRTLAKGDPLGWRDSSTRGKTVPYAIDPSMGNVRLNAFGDPGSSRSGVHKEPDVVVPSRIGARIQPAMSAPWYILPLTR